MRRVGDHEGPAAGRGDGPDTGERAIADRSRVTPPGGRSATNRFFAHLVMLGWHGLVIATYFTLLDRQSGGRKSWGNSPQEDMLNFGVYVGAPALLGTLLAGLILLRRLPRSRISSAIVLGTAAASPTLLFVAAVAGPVLG